jgi:hypothetical protein
VQNRDNLDGTLKISDLSANTVYEKAEKQLKNNLKTPFIQSYQQINTLFLNEKNTLTPDKAKHSLPGRLPTRVSWPSQPTSRINTSP